MIGFRLFWISWHARWLVTAASSNRFWSYSSHAGLLIVHQIGWTCGCMAPAPLFDHVHAPLPQKAHTQKEYLSTGKSRNIHSFTIWNINFYSQNYSIIIFNILRWHYWLKFVRRWAAMVIFSDFPKGKWILCICSARLSVSGESANGLWASWLYS